VPYLVRLDDTNLGLIRRECREAGGILAEIFPINSNKIFPENFGIILARDFGKKFPRNPGDYSIINFIITDYQTYR